MKKDKVAVSGGFRTSAEAEEASLNKEWFDRNPGTWESKMENFPKYVRRQNLTRFLVLYEIFKKVLNVKGSIIECGVNEGYGISSWAKFSAILEPVNLTRRIYGFDTFEGFPSVDKKDGQSDNASVGSYSVADDYELYLDQVLAYHESESPISHLKKYELVKGDASKTLEKYLQQHPETIVALAYFDFDIYEPTKKCLELIKGRLSKGSIIGFDELNFSEFPGETIAFDEVLGIQNYRIVRSPITPLPSYIIVE
mgnify:CR=1 FL=1